MVMFSVAGLVRKTKHMPRTIGKYILGYFNGLDGRFVQHGNFVSKADKQKGERAKNAHAIHHAASSVCHHRQPLLESILTFIVAI